MKIFVFEGNHPDYNIPTHFPLIKHTEQAAQPMPGAAQEAMPQSALLTLPDTALLTRGRPLFVPDEAWPCCVQAHLVVRISRLGRHVAPRFAHRYYDALTIGACCTARDLLHRLRREGLPWELSRAFDGAAAIGEWLPTDEATRPDRTEVTLRINGEEAQRFRTADLLSHIDEQVAAVSRFYKLCQGDLLFTGTCSAGTDVRIDDRIEGLADGRRLLAYNIK